MAEKENTRDCWDQSGSHGDGSCPELREHMLCGNCPVFSKSGKTLLDRPPPGDYTRQWTEELSREIKTRDSGIFGAMVFSVCGQSLALGMDALEKVIPIRPAHRVPGRSNRVFQGLVNVAGELLLCASLSDFLEMEQDPSPASGETTGGELMIVARCPRGPWVFPVDRISGVHMVSMDRLREIPATMANKARHFSQGLFPLEDTLVILLDVDALGQELEIFLQAKPGPENDPPIRRSV